LRNYHFCLQLACGTLI